MSMQDERNKAYEIVREIGAVDFIDAIIKLYTQLHMPDAQTIQKPELIRDKFLECRHCGKEASLNFQGYCNRCAQMWHS